MKRAAMPMILCALAAGTPAAARDADGLQTEYVFAIPFEWVLPN